MTLFPPSMAILKNSLNADAGVHRLYGSNPTMTSFHSDMCTEVAEAKLVDYRDEKVAGFEIDGDNLICLPQAYELFLKNLVGGLHTVYTKLKRLDIVPRVCNVEQVRALRSLGAIQPGVNRCKLISCRDFDALYQDCTTASSRPGRPPKRSPLAFGGGDGAPIAVKRSKHGELGDKHGGSNSSNMNGLFGNHVGTQLFPFFPMTPQQLMMSQMFSANQTAMLAKQLSEMNQSLSPDKQDSTSEPDEPGTSENRLLDSCAGNAASSEQKGGLDEGAINLCKRAAAPNGCAGNKSLAGQDRTKEPSAAAAMKGDDFSDLEDNEEDEVDDDEDVFGPQLGPMNVATAQAALSDAQDAFAANCFGPVENILRNIHGLIEVAAMTTRHQMEQAQKEKWELTKLYNEEKTKRIDAEKSLKQEQQTISILKRRVRLVKKEKMKLQDQLLGFHEKQNRPAANCGRTDTKSESP